jgi:hypothetical protein
VLVDEIDIRTNIISENEEINILSRGEFEKIKIGLINERKCRNQ